MAKPGDAEAERQLRGEGLGDSRGGEVAVKEPSSLLKALYGTFFIVVLPGLLIAWAKASEDSVPVTVRAWPGLGVALAGAGALGVILGMAALWVHGKGLPMNVSPPARYVTQGIYRLLPHPIYTGYVALCAGVSLAVGSGSGLWLVTPVVALGCAALVLGYERHDMRERFGEDLPDGNALLAADEPRAPTTLERIRCYLSVLAPWVILYEASVALGIPKDAVSAYLPFEQRLPVWEWTEAIYASCYVLTAFVPLTAGSARELRRFSARGWLAMAVAFPVFLLAPLVAVPRAFTPQGVLGTLLEWERAIDTPAAAFPSFHVIWALLTAEVFSQRKPLVRWAWRGWAWLVAASCVTTGMHALVDVLAGIVVVMLASHATAAWRSVREAAEWMANSWKEWRAGPIRVINHGAYGGLAGAAGVLITGLLTGRENAPAVVLAAIAGLVGSALWAQWVEGSPTLLRPFGFYGGVLGIALGTLFAPWLGTSTWLLLAAYAVSAPWIQAIGRLRCLVQGCCHGRPAPDAIGIRHVHPRSRVCRLTGWTDVPLHPTPAYSILWNAAVGAAMARLWALHTPLHLIAGLYLILSGAGRYVEEAYRGEPQTPIFARLRIYQWIAIGTMVIGAGMTALGNAGAAPAAQWSLSPLLPALAFGALCWFALGMDFPEANRRFARLV